MLLVAVALIASVGGVSAEDKPSASTIDNITKSARDMLPSMPSLPSVSLPSMHDLSMPDLSDASSKMMTEFNSFSRSVPRSRSWSRWDMRSVRLR
jgi:hypothetical protein